MNKNSKALEVTEVGVMLALSMVLFTISEFIPWPAWIQGGGVTLFGHVPIVVLSYRRGLKDGFAASVLLGIFELIMGLSNFAWVKGAISYVVVALFDYILAFGIIGIGGIFRKAKGKTSVKLVAGGILACALRFICHFISGITVWSEYTQGNGGFTNLDSLIHGITKGSLIYSVTYNGGYMLPEAVITAVGCLAVALIIPKELNKYLKKDNTEKTEETE